MMTQPRGRLAALAIAGATLLPGQSIAAEEGETLWRLFMADHTAPTITALDLDAPERRWTFGTDGPARLYASPSGRAVAAVQSDDDRVSFLHSGISLDGHGDHADIETSDPARIDATLEGPRPFHLVSHGDELAIAFDKGGHVTVLEESAVLAGDIDGMRFPQNRPHHGFAVRMGAYFVSSVASDAPVAADEAPSRIGIQGFDVDGAPVGEMQTCTDLHGEAFSGEYLLAGCKEGVVAVRDGGDAPDFTMLPYPADFPEGDTGTLLGSAAMQVFLGDYGDSSVVVIDPTAEPFFRLVDLPFRRVDFILDPARPQFAYIFTEDGSLHRLNMLSAEIERSARITQPYSMDGHWRDPRPRLAIAGDRLAITDPMEGQVRIIGTDDLAEEGTIAVEGTPYNIIAVGGSGLSH